jgi:hypothetical protein
MDAFKAMEIERMRLGGNKTWRDFFDEADANTMSGIRLVLDCNGGGGLSTSRESGRSEK